MIKLWKCRAKNLIKFFTCSQTAVKHSSNAFFLSFQLAWIFFPQHASFMHLPFFHPELTLCSSYRWFTSRLYHFTLIEFHIFIWIYHILVLINRHWERCWILIQLFKIARIQSVWFSWLTSRTRTSFFHKIYFQANKFEFFLSLGINL